MGLQQHIPASPQGAAAQSGDAARAQNNGQVLSLCLNRVGAHQNQVATVDLQAGLAAGLHTLALQKRGLCARKQSEVTADADQAQIEPVTVAHLRIAGRCDGQVRKVVATGRQHDVTTGAQARPGHIAIGTNEGRGATLHDIAQAVAQGQIATGTDLTKAQSHSQGGGASAFDSNTDLVAGSQAINPGAAPGHAQADIRTIAIGQHLGDVHLAAQSAGDLHKGTPRAGLHGAQALRIDINFRANKARTHRLALKLGQTALGDDDVFLVEPLASAVVDDAA